MASKVNFFTFKGERKDLLLKSSTPKDGDVPACLPFGATEANMDERRAHNPNTCREAGSCLILRGLGGRLPPATRPSRRAHTAGDATSTESWPGKFHLQAQAGEEAL